MDYRLAPENPYPAGPDDCEAVAVWLINNAKSEFGTDKLTIGGESAGAGLTTFILLRLRDKHGYTGIKAVNLTYGMYDANCTPSVLRWGERRLMLTTKTLQWFWESYVSEDQRNDPDVSTLHADLSDMPLALFTVGTMDPLLDDSLFMYMRWIAANNEAELAVYPGGAHGFNLFTIPNKLRMEANSRIIEYIANAIE